MAAVFPHRVEEKLGEEATKEFISWLKVNERFAEVDRRLDALNARLISTMKWTVGTVLGMGSLVAILMSIYKFMG